jgi:hypothetical protein
MLASCLAVSTVRGQDDDVTVKPLSVGSVIDVGQIVQGRGDFNGVPIQRTTVWLQQAISIGPRLDVRAGLGSIFWYKSPPEQPGSGEAGRFKTLPKFGVGISRADMEYRFSDVDPMFTLQAGYFPYKYNPDARNLGEYLLRAGAYPGYLSTGGWNLISGGGTMVQGLRLNVSLWGGRFQSDFLLPMEQDRPYINGDLSPTYVASLKPVRGLELGAGASCYHCISVKPSHTSPELKPRTDGQSQTSFGYGNGYVIENPNYDAVADSGPTPIGFAERYDGNNPNANSRYLIDTTRFYTFKGVKLMARASLDPKAYVPLPMLGPEDLKVFGEVALLGVENRPFYFEKRTERMPVMFGVNLPTRLLGYTYLDVLSFQVEYYNSPFANATRNSDKVNRLTLPIMSGYDGGGILTDDPNLFDMDHRNVTGDDWKWSVYAARQVIKGLRLHAQVANDHSRFPDEWARYSVVPATVLPKDWYYVVRLELGI